MQKEEIQRLQEEAEKTDLVFDGKPNEKEYRSFLIYHTYSQWYGLLSLVISIASIVFMIVSWKTMPVLFKAILILVILMLLTGLPASLWFQAKLRANDTKAPDMRYAFLIEGVKSNVGDNSYFVRWRKFFKVRETSQVILLYLNKTRAMIVPKRTLGDRVDDVKGLIERHIPNKKRVRWRRG